MEVEGFRDPFVWREADGWYCVIGSGIVGVGGNILLYRSQDLVHWEYLHELCRGEVDETGRMWECPNFFPLGNKHVLLISPIPLRKVLYLVGEYRDHRFTPERTEIVDDGGCYYAPQVTLDDQRAPADVGLAAREPRGRDPEGGRLVRRDVRADRAVADGGRAPGAAAGAGAGDAARRAPGVDRRRAWRTAARTRSPS